VAKAKYVFRMETGLFGDDPDAQAIGDAIDALIDEKNEHVTGDEIVAAARKHDSPMRGCFTWDDAEAAHKWRKKEARNMIAMLVHEKDGKPTRTRAFCYLHHPEHGGKKVLLSTRSALSRAGFREELKEQQLRALQRKLQNWNAAVGGNKSMRGLAKHVNRLMKQVERELMIATL